MKITTLLTLCLIFSHNLFSLNPCESFNQLVQGNQRFVNNKNVNNNSNEALRLTQKAAQNPFAVIVACADSRVAPEIVFDQSIGDLFVVRVAGNVIGPLELESIEYAVKHLGSSIILVMGHQNCGAVDAVIQNQTQDIPFIAQTIKPAVLKAQSAPSSNSLLESAIKLNASQMATFLKQSRIVKEGYSQGSVGIKAAYYNFSTGCVEVLQ